MANLGAIATVVPVDASVRVLDVWSATHAGMSGTLVPDGAYTRPVPSMVFGEVKVLIYLDNSGEIRGTVLEGANPVAGARVDLYHRLTRTPIDTQTTDAAGGFAFSYLVRSPEAFFAVAFDPEGGDSYNALIFDRLTPV